jgi:hypothetical protein
MVFCYIYIPNIALASFTLVAVLATYIPQLECISLEEYTKKSIGKMNGIVRSLFFKIHKKVRLELGTVICATRRSYCATQFEHLGSEMPLRSGWDATSQVSSETCRAVSTRP